MAMKRLRTGLTRKKIKYATPKAYIDEAYRYFANAKDRLREAPVQYNRYQDVKPVREACATCYVAVLLAIDGYLVEHGFSVERLPTSTEGYRRAIQKYISLNGQLTSAFSNAHEVLHIFGYYRGGAVPEMIKAGFQNAKLVIDTLAKSIQHQHKNMK